MVTYLLDCGIGTMRYKYYPSERDPQNPGRRVLDCCLFEAALLRVCNEKTIRRIWSIEHRWSSPDSPVGVLPEEELGEALKEIEEDDPKEWGLAEKNGLD